MRKLSYLFIATSTFLIGTFTFYGYFFLVPVKVSEIKYAIPLSELEKNPRHYISRKILLQEELIAKKDNEGRLYFYIESPREKCLPYMGCSGMEYFDCYITKSLNFLRLVEKNEVEMIEAIAEKNAQLSRTNPTGHQQLVYGAKVEIEGYIALSEWSDEYFSVDVISIKQISPIRIIPEINKNQVFPIEVTPAKGGKHTS